MTYKEVLERDIETLSRVLTRLIEEKTDEKSIIIVSTMLDVAKSFLAMEK